MHKKHILSVYTLLFIDSLSDSPLLKTTFSIVIFFLSVSCFCCIDIHQFLVFLSQLAAREEDVRLQLLPEVALSLSDRMFC